jgi:hypothetical protein
MATAKKANVTARIQPEVKKSAEAILDKMMVKGMEQAKADDSFTVDEAFSSIRAEING